MSTPAQHLKVVQTSDPGTDSSWVNVVFDDGSFWILKRNEDWLCLWQPDGTSDAFKIRCLASANEDLRQQLAAVTAERDSLAQKFEERTIELFARIQELGGSV